MFSFSSSDENDLDTQSKISETTHCAKSKANVKQVNVKMSSESTKGIETFQTEVEDHQVTVKIVFD